MNSAHNKSESVNFNSASYILVGDFDEKFHATNSNIFVCVVLSVTIIVGLVGNTVNLIVFSQPAMRSGSTFRFLLYSSLCDILVLIACSTDALVRFGFEYEFRLMSPFVCRLHTFLTYFLTQSSSTILMAVSVDRALVITNRSIDSLFASNRKKNKNKEKNPGQAKHMGRLMLQQFLGKFHRVDLVIVGIVLFLTILNSHYIMFMNLNLFTEEEFLDMFTMTNTNYTTANESSKNSSNQAMEDFKDNQTNSQSLFYACFPLKGSMYDRFLLNVWTWIDICVFSLIPFVVMSVCSVIILIQIKNRSKKFIEVINGNNKNTSEHAKMAIYKRVNRNRQLLYMLLITNVYFLLSLLPYCVFFVLFRGQEDNTKSQNFVHMLLYTNNAINFLFYYFSSQKYREVLKQIFYNRTLERLVSRSREKIMKRSFSDHRKTRQSVAAVSIQSSKKSVMTRNSEQSKKSTRTTSIPVVLECDDTKFLS